MRSQNVEDLVDKSRLAFCQTYSQKCVFFSFGKKISSEKKIVNFMKSKTKFKEKRKRTFVSICISNVFSKNKIKIGSESFEMKIFKEMT